MEQPDSRPNKIQRSLHESLSQTYRTIRRGVVRHDWAMAEHAFCEFCQAHADLIPTWWVDEYVFQAMRLWSEGQVDEALRHFANFINRAAGEPLVDAAGDAQLVREALSSPPERVQRKQ